ncbi:TIGR01620 family protein [Frigidibacter sp. SD6-1]|uniref:TIGR01620 family protein n=1 Tax=Frigidibacter sp. SD6-1 TaxID=3032581 RepID=UPI0024DF4C74|nr:TIGR01620 family protein [Frigidibacter sp. SD6-1]
MKGETGTGRRGPLLVELDPAEMPVVADLAPLAEPADVAIPAPARRGWRLGAWLVGTAGSLLLFLLTLALWSYVESLFVSYPLLGSVAVVLAGLLALLSLLFVARELLALMRLRRLDGLRERARAAVGPGDLGAARAVQAEVVALYRGRAELAWVAARHGERSHDLAEAGAVLALVEEDYLGPLDQLARREIEAAARQVAAATAIVPLALADVAVALIANTRMVRRIAAIYGGRSGAFGSWRLMRRVAVHLVATGAVAVGDDLIHSVAGGGLLSKLSRRFGEGVINGALTARVGVAAMEVCRPLPFAALPRPKVTNLLTRGLAGLFGRRGEAAAPDFDTKSGRSL